MTDIDEQLAELSRGTDEILPQGGLEEKLKLGRPLNIKVGSILLRRICMSGKP